LKLSQLFFRIFSGLLFATVVFCHSSFNMTTTNQTSSEYVLYLVRHAKASHDTSFRTDFDRGLEKRGEEDALKTGKFLKTKIGNPERIISSNSVRTTQTVKILFTGMGLDANQVEFDSAIYRCSGEQLLNIISKQPSSKKTLMVIGHNPAITRVANELQSKKQFNEVPTTGVVAIRFNINSWADVKTMKGKLDFFSDPDDIKSDGKSKID